MEPRGTQQWIEQVRETGRWDRPRFWKHPSYQAVSPWTPAEHRDAFAALRVVYPPKVVRRVFEDATSSLPWISGLLMDPFRPDLSGLLALGFDAAHARVERFDSLVRALRKPAGYRGARLELAVLAALERSRIKYQYEPYAARARACARAGASHPNPDVRIKLGEWVTADIKDLEYSARARRAQERFLRATRGTSAQEWRWIPATVEALPLWSHLERTILSEARLERLADKVYQAALARMEHMLTHGVREARVANLMRLTVTPAGYSHGYTGHALDDPRDAQRVVGRLDEAAAQIPTTDVGMIFVEPSESESLPLVLDLVRQWLGGPNLHVVGVVVLGDAYHPGAPHSTKVPHLVWQERAPARCRRPSHWSKLYAGLNWRWMRAAAARDGQ